MDNRDALNRSAVTGIWVAMGMLKRRAGEAMGSTVASLERLARLL